jgi:hypothetical protein
LGLDQGQDRRSEFGRGAVPERIGKRRRPKVFWDFQRHALSAIGERVHRLKLGAWGLAAFLDLALNPKQTVERLVRHSPKARPKSLEKLHGYIKKSNT